MAHAYTVNSGIVGTTNSSYLRRDVTEGDRVVVADHMKKNCDGIPWLTYEGEADDLELISAHRPPGQRIHSSNTPPELEPLEVDLEEHTATTLAKAHGRAELDRIAHGLGIDYAAHSRKSDLAEAIIAHYEGNQED